jgi:hypothetical protein
VAALVAALQLVVDLMAPLQGCDALPGCQL